MLETPPVRTKAGWAVWGKPPGTRDDYSVLASSSGPFSQADFGRILSRFIPGTPQIESRGPAALPWVTISWVGVGESLHLGIAIEEGTDQIDGVGRPITRTRYFCVPYAAMAQGPVSYASLYRMVEPLRLPNESGDLIPLELEPLNPQEIAAGIGRFGERPVAIAASLLLRGAVYVVQPDSPSLTERLDFIDAVASLLPYGYRSRYTAATWADSGSQHRIRLSFAAKASDAGSTVSWLEPVGIPTGTGPAGEYMEQFERLRGRSDRSVKVYALPAVIGYLARDVEPRKFEQPEYAVESLCLVDLPFAVLGALREGTADAGRLRLVFSRSRIMELEPAGRMTLLEALSRYGEPADWPAIQQWLEPVTDGDQALLRGILTLFGHSNLWGAALDRETLRKCLNTAADHELEDALLAALVRPPDDYGAPRQKSNHQQVLSLLADLLRDLVLTTVGIASHPQTRDALAGNPPMACVLLARLAGSGQAAVRYIDWLAPAVPKHLISPFRIAMAEAPGRLDDSDIGRLSSSGIDCVSALLSVASACSTLDRVLPSFVHWLTSRGELPPSERRHWHDLLPTLSANDPRIRAWLDIAILEVRGAPQALPPAADHPDSQIYVSTFDKTWAALRKAYPSFDDDRLAAALAQYLDQHSWAIEYQQAAAVVDLAKRVSKYTSQPVLMGTVTGTLATSAKASRWDFAQALLARAERREPAVVRDEVGVSLRNLGPGVQPRQVAKLCVRAAGQNMQPDVVLADVARSGAVTSRGFGLDLLMELQHEMREARASWEVTVSWMKWLVAVLIELMPGAETEEGFGEFVARFSIGEIWLNLDLIYTAGGGSAKEPPELTEAELKELESVKRSIESTLKRVKKSHRQPRSLWRSTAPAGEENTAKNSGPVPAIAGNERTSPGRE